MCGSVAADARAWWKGLVRGMLEKGADGFMDDFGEQVLSDMVFADGSTGASMHNRYPVLQHRATREAIDELLADEPGREIYFFTRAGYTGRFVSSGLFVRSVSLATYPFPVPLCILI